MDDVEDDARYPPNPYPQDPHSRHHSAHSHRSKPPIHPQFSRNFNDQDDDDEDEDESNSEGINNSNHNGNVNSSVQHRPSGYIEEAEGEEAVDDDEDDSSMESRGKRRKLDNFEFVPRKQLPAAIASSSKPPGVKNSPPEWSEDSTFILLDAWGDLYVKNGRKSLRSDEWSEVAKKVNRASRITRSDSQCRNRLDTLKKKYKKEKTKLAEIANFKSDWVYFKTMDSLMSSPLAMPAPAPASKSSPLRLACGVDAGEYVFANSRAHLNRANAMDDMRESPGDTGTEDDDREEDDDDESDGLPPAMSEKRKERGHAQSFSSSSFRMLAESIQKFGEVYEKIESSKRQQMVELERMRKEFHRDLEAQKRQILERAQAEIARIGQEEGDDDEEDERMTGDGDGDDDEDDEIDGSAENLSG